MSGTRYRYRDGDGQPLMPGLEREEVTFLTYEPGTLPPFGEPGDLAAWPTPADGVHGGLAARLADGWHRVGSISTEIIEEPELTEFRTADDRHVRSVKSGWTTVEVTLTDIDPEIIDLITGGGVLERRRGRGHPASAVSTPTVKVADWECDACGAVSSDRGLFDEIGCDTVLEDGVWVAAGGVQ